MAVTRKKKEQALGDLEARLADAKSVVFVDYRGTTVKKMDELRKKLRNEGVYTKVAKITLIAKAMQKHGFDTTGLDFKAPVAVAISSEDEVAPARIVSEFIKLNKNLNIVMGAMEKKLLTAAEVDSLAKLPGKQDLRGMLVGTIAAPVSSFVNVLAANLRSLVYALNAIKESKV